MEHGLMERTWSLIYKQVSHLFSLSLVFLIGETETNKTLYSPTQIFLGQMMLEKSETMVFNIIFQIGRKKSKFS